MAQIGNADISLGRQAMEGERDDNHLKMDRLVEIFTHGNAVHLRVGPPLDDTKSESSVTIRLSKNEFSD